jgi:hypothetical protein
MPKKKTVIRKAKKKSIGDKQKKAGVYVRVFAWTTATAWMIFRSEMKT